MGPTTVRAALAAAADQLADASPSAELDARVLLAHNLGCNAAWLIAHPDDTLGAAQQGRYDELVARRRRGEPIAYITGTREFWSLTLTVTRDVLIPRPETELVVERALTRLPDRTAAQVLDLGTGSGAIALAIASERPACAVTAIDVSAAALAVAVDNARRCGIDNVHFVRGDWFEAVAGQRFDLIVANPPYVAAGDPHLTLGDLRFEPQAALRSGDDGLRDIRRIARGAPGFIATGGRLILEHGFEHQAAVAAVLSEYGYLEIACFRDHAGQPRVTECRAPDAPPALKQ